MFDRRWEMRTCLRCFVTALPPFGEISCLQHHCTFDAAIAPFALLVFNWYCAHLPCTLVKMDPIEAGSDPADGQYIIDCYCKLEGDALMSIGLRL